MNLMSMSYICTKESLGDLRPIKLLNRFTLDTSYRIRFDIIINKIASEMNFKFTGGYICLHAALSIVHAILLVSSHGAEEPSSLKNNNKNR